MSTDPLAGTVASLIPAAREELAEPVAFRSVADPALAPSEECHKAAAIGFRGPGARIHSVDESVSVGELRRPAVAEAQFMRHSVGTVDREQRGGAGHGGAGHRK
ncbi:hypothetical protein ABZ479_29435 [Streptomyces sp. NPDC005722]